MTEGVVVFMETRAAPAKAARVCSWTCDVLTDQGRDESGWKDKGEEEENEEQEVYIINPHTYTHT